MKRIVYPLIAVMAIVGGSTEFAAAKTDCNKDIAQFDLSVKTTKASNADVARAKKMRNEAAKDCTEKGGTARGDTDMTEAMKLIGVRK
jgi:hypothetical protein